MKLLHIYPQEYCHTEAKIVGNRDALLQLRRTINKALATGSAVTPSGYDSLYASDGEGYELRVVLAPPNWNDAFWEGGDNLPFYAMLDRG